MYGIRGRKVRHADHPGDEDQTDTHRRTHGEDDEHLGPQEELDGGQHAERQSQHDRRHRCRTSISSRQSTISGGTGIMPSIRWASLRLMSDEGREPVEEAAHERRGCPRHPPSQQDVDGQRRQERAQRQGHVEGGDGPEQPRHRGEHETESDFGRVGQQVHPGRVEHVGRVQRVEVVGDGERRPLEEPREQRRVAAAARRGRRRVGRPDVPPDHHREDEVGRGAEQQRRPAPAARGRRRLRRLFGGSGPRRDVHRLALLALEHRHVPTPTRSSPGTMPLAGVDRSLPSGRDLRRRTGQAGGTHHDPHGHDPPALQARGTR